MESMATLQALASDPDWTPDAINVLAPSLAAAEPLARRLDALPEVSRTRHAAAASFPTQQKEKLDADSATPRRASSPLLGASLRSRRPPTQELQQQPGDDGSCAATGGDGRHDGSGRALGAAPGRGTGAPAGGRAGRPRRGRGGRGRSASASCSIRSARCCRPGR